MVNQEGGFAGERHHLFSGCQLTSAPTTFIDVVYARGTEQSVNDALGHFAQDYVDDGCIIKAFQFVRDESHDSVGSVRVATLDMMCRDKRLYLVLEAFPVEDEYYIIEGIGGNQAMAQYLIDSMASIIDSVVVVK